MDPGSARLSVASSPIQNNGPSPDNSRPLGLPPALELSLPVKGV